MAKLSELVKLIKRTLYNSEECFGKVKPNSLLFGREKTAYHFTALCHTSAMMDQVHRATVDILEEATDGRT